jgi:hypothetical protein
MLFLHPLIFRWYQQCSRNFGKMGGRLWLRLPPPHPPLLAVYSSGQDLKLAAISVKLQSGVEKESSSGFLAQQDFLYPCKLDKRDYYSTVFESCRNEHLLLFLTIINVLYIQGADNKLGHFLSQDIYATANHRNYLRHSLESCPSLV